MSINWIEALNTLQEPLQNNTLTLDAVATLVKIFAETSHLVSAFAENHKYYANVSWYNSQQENGNQVVTARQQRSLQCSILNHPKLPERSSLVSRSLKIFK